MRTLCSLFAAAALSTAVTVSRHSSLAMFKASRVAARQWNIYLSGEIHSPWRSNLVSMMQERGLPVTLTGPNDSHADSDDAGAMILGMEEQRKKHQTLLAELELDLGLVVARNNRSFEPDPRHKGGNVLGGDLVRVVLDLGLSRKEADENVVDSAALPHPALDQRNAARARHPLNREKRFGKICGVARII